MADRDRYDWNRGPEFDDRNREYGRGVERDRGYQDRGAISRGTDEVRSWFGDEEARRRREMDEQRERYGERHDHDYGPNSPRVRSEHGWGGSREAQRDHWEPHTEYRTSGDQREFGDDPQRRYGSWQYSGGFAAGQPSSAFSGGYGAGNDGSTQWRDNPPTSFRQGTPGTDYGGYSSGAPRAYGRDFGATTGEGRWGQPSFYRGGWSDWSGSGSFAGRGPRNYQRSDERIREDVNERLTADPRIDASDIDVRVEKCEVILTGTVDDRRARRLAEEIIEDLPGVRDVRNDLKVRHGRWGQDEGHRYVGEQSRQHEDGSLGHTGDPQRRDDVTTVNVKDAGRK